MNILSLIHKPYEVFATFNEDTNYYKIKFRNDFLNDTDYYDYLDLNDIKTLKDNAKRLYDALEKQINKN